MGEWKSASFDLPLYSTSFKDKVPIKAKKDNSNFLIRVKMSKIVLKSLSILLGAFFIFLGVLKISPKISKDLHKDLRTEYAKYAKVFPLAKTLEFKVPSKWYRRIVGCLEILSGIIMMAIPSRGAKNAANILLLMLKVLNVYSHWAISDEFERTAPSLVFLLMLSCRMVVDWQMERKPEVEEKTGKESAEITDQDTSKAA